MPKAHGAVSELCGTAWLRGPKPSAADVVAVRSLGRTDCRMMRAGVGGIKCSPDSSASRRKPRLSSPCVVVRWRRAKSSSATQRNDHKPRRTMVAKRPAGFFFPIAGACLILAQIVRTGPAIHRDDDPNARSRRLEVSVRCPSSSRSTVGPLRSHDRFANRATSFRTWTSGAKRSRLQLRTLPRNQTMRFESSTSSLGILQSPILKTCLISSNDRSCKRLRH